MGRLLFAPFRVGAALLAGLLSKKVFDVVWGLVDEEEAPKPKHREISLAKLTVALLVEGAVFRLVRGLVDHGARSGWWRVTGSWPGEEAPEPE